MNYFRLLVFNSTALWFQSNFPFSARTATDFQLNFNVTWGSLRINYERMLTIPIAFPKHFQTICTYCIRAQIKCFLTAILSPHCPSRFGCGQLQARLHLLVTKTTAPRNRRKLIWRWHRKWYCPDLELPKLNSYSYCPQLNWILRLYRIYWIQIHIRNIFSMYKYFQY